MFEQEAAELGSAHRYTSWPYLLVTIAVAPAPQVVVSTGRLIVGDGKSRELTFSSKRPQSQVGLEADKTSSAVARVSDRKQVPAISMLTRNAHRTQRSRSAAAQATSLAAFISWGRTTRVRLQLRRIRSGGPLEKVGVASPLQSLPHRSAVLGDARGEARRRCRSSREERRHGENRATIARETRSYAIAHTAIIDAHTSTSFASHATSNMDDAKGLCGRASTASRIRCATKNR